ncbi:MAG: hypothetical protein AAFU82_04115 [Pseudomonadota bacterium]
MTNERASANGTFMTREQMYMHAMLIEKLLDVAEVLACSEKADDWLYFVNLANDRAAELRSALHDINEGRASV